ncbi:uncharacterized protein K452DRAFT_217956 [Aplosporella prunicola CBS 121167]|uniref:Glutamyl-tRNA(Gln) amidotransferase subunit B, mitochondrial n=1 Tax=Aplosporella prunicola CBS 121167 TaxID=1176127 RepID=A0A6A6BWE5_9PEZI|nr:uncharacterized protein K452DRAFT_217956 [Aplosporella prunicola CBS 121167]KAF2147227.1 hypothetical protein K452DRAFT_217956 [Aplosporella prunicola CBS 121167]
MLSACSKAAFGRTLRQQSLVCQSCLQPLRQSMGIRAPVSRYSMRCLHVESKADDLVPFRKLQKEEAKRKKAEGQGQTTISKSKAGDPRLQKWELTVGIEIHAELNTARKLFSGAGTSSNELPNSHVALFDVAFPGTQPQFQSETLIPALRAAMALDCDIQTKSSFDRKHYFYQDQPAGYQITQYYEPLARDGKLTLYDHDGIAPEDGKSITIGIKQVQMEQDTAKSIQQPPSIHLLDFNRVSHPLIEIITLPHIHHPSTAAACVRKIQAILRSVDAVTAGMEAGGLRADVNVSVRERLSSESQGSNNSYYGVTGLGQRTEIKNLSSFKAVEDAIIAERNRQIEVLKAGGVIEGETRGWTLGSTETRRLRGKEGEVDYRYMPDPDLGAVLIGEELIQRIRHTLPALPDEITQMLVDNPKYGMLMKDAKNLLRLDTGDRLDYYLEVVDILHQQTTADERSSMKLGRVAGNWLLMELGALFTTAEISWTENTVSSEQLASIILHLLRKQITGPTAKQLLSTVFYGDDRPVRQIIDDENLLLRPMSREEYFALAGEILDDNPDAIEAIKTKGQKGKLKFLLGQMIRRGDEGRVEAKKAEEVLEEMLETRV